MDFYNTAFSHGSCSSKLFAKNVDNMLPFTQDSNWNFTSNDGVRKATTHPIMTGTSVLGLVFNGGVMVAADTLASFGSMARFTKCERVLKVNDKIVLGAGGDFADFQYMAGVIEQHVHYHVVWVDSSLHQVKVNDKIVLGAGGDFADFQYKAGVIEQHVINEECLNDGFNLKPKSLYSWLTRTLYNKRSKLEPLWNTFVVGGMQDGKPFLGLVDKIGTAFETPTIATGYGAYMAQPLLRERVEKNPDISETEALDLLKHCLRILYYRDARSFPKFTIGIVTNEGARVVGPVEIDSDWTVAHYVGAKVTAQ